ncbi:Leucine-rich repeat serine/threonine-protein kinase 2 [Rhizophlyctis rosea]|nr:Leucine-rich repeat serine/threonine-protein kinase 2 [Rhizophlyctis rosea]
MSYCWLNSEEAARKGHVDTDAHCGLCDPRQLARELSNAGYNTWLDVDRLGDGEPLYEEIVKGILPSKCVVACVSEAYVKSKNCNLEFIYVNKVQIPLVVIIVGTQKFDWTKSTIGFLAADTLYIETLNTSFPSIVERVQRAVSRFADAVPNSSVEPSPLDPLDILWRAAEGGDPEAQYKLAVTLEHSFGDDMKKDHGDARIWYQKAADQGYAKAIKWLDSNDEMAGKENKSFDRSFATTSSSRYDNSFDDMKQAVSVFLSTVDLASQPVQILPFRESRETIIPVEAIKDPQLHQGSSRVSRDLSELSNYLEEITVCAPPRRKKFGWNGEDDSASLKPLITAIRQVIADSEAARISKIAIFSSLNFKKAEHDFEELKDIKHNQVYPKPDNRIASMTGVNWKTWDSLTGNQFSSSFPTIELAMLLENGLPYKLGGSVQMKLRLVAPKSIDQDTINIQFFGGHYFRPVHVKVPKMKAHDVIEDILNFTFNDEHSATPLIGKLDLLPASIEVQMKYTSAQATDGERRKVKTFLVNGFKLEIREKIFLPRHCIP